MTKVFYIPERGGSQSGPESGTVLAKRRSLKERVRIEKWGGTERSGMSLEKVI